jgi:protein-disulfide isomerase
MVLCLLALPVLAILGIFSVKYRRLTLDALECLFKTITLRKCKSGLDDRIKADLTGKVLKFSPKTAGLLYKHYKIISWIILILFLWSFYASSVGVYNYVNYGNCNGPESTGFCVFDPTGENSKIAQIDTIDLDEQVAPSLEDDDPIFGNHDAELTIIEFGCYACPFTRKAEPTVQNIIAYYQGRVNLQFKTFRIPHHNETYRSALAANCALEQGYYHKYHKRLFDFQENQSKEFYFVIAKDLGMDEEKFKECISEDRYKDEIDGDTTMGINAGVPGTPTFFINDKKIVGPKPFKTFKKIINKELKR